MRYLYNQLSVIVMTVVLLTLFTTDILANSRARLHSHLAARHRTGSLPPAGGDHGDGVLQQHQPRHHHRLSKRSFFEIRCKGVYDKVKFAKLDSICEDCFNLYRQNDLRMLCMNNCFTTDYFKGCMEALLLTDRINEIQSDIKQLHGADPGI